MTWNMPLINEIKNKRGIKQQDLAKQLNISRQLISYYFHSSPTIDKALTLARALSTPDNPVDWKDLIA